MSEPRTPSAKPGGPTYKTDDSIVIPAKAGIQANLHTRGVLHDYRFQDALAASSGTLSRRNV